MSTISVLFSDPSNRGHPLGQDNTIVIYNRIPKTGFKFTSSNYKMIQHSSKTSLNLTTSDCKMIRHSSKTSFNYEII